LSGFKSFNKLNDLQVLLVVSTLQLEKPYGLESDGTSIYSITLRTTSLFISAKSDVIQKDIEPGIAQNRLVEDSGQSELATTQKSEIALSGLVFEK
jgi:hypothetical protein